MACTAAARLADADPVADVKAGRCCSRSSSAGRMKHRQSWVLGLAQRVAAQSWESLITSRRLRRVRLMVAIQEHATRAQHLRDLAHRAAQVVDVLEHVAAVDGVKAGVRERQLLADTVLVVDRSRWRARARRGKGVDRWVDAGHAAPSAANSSARRPPPQPTSRILGPRDRSQLLGEDARM